MRTLKLLIMLAIFVLLSSVGPQALVPPVAHASTSYTWTGKGHDGGNWNNPANWDPNGMPSDGDSVIIGPHPPDAPVAYVTGVPQGLTLENLTLEGAGTQVLGGSLTVTGSFNWSGDGTLRTSVTVDGTANISDNGQKYLQSPGGSGTTTLALHGVSTLSSSGLILSGVGGIIINTGIFYASPGSMISADACCVGPAKFINQGSFNILPPLPFSPTSVTISDVAFNDSGKVSFASGATLDLEIAPSTFASGVIFNGSGILLIQSSASIQLSGSVNLGSGTTFQLATGGRFNTPGTLTGKGTLKGSGGTFSWTGGTLNGVFTVASSIQTAISGSAQKILQSPGGIGVAALILQGSTTFSGTGTLILSGGGVRLDNYGTFSAQNEVTISAGSCCASPAQFNNHGTFISDVGAGNTFRISVPGVAFNNSGTVDLKSGTFQFADPGYTQTAGTTKLDGGSLTSTSPSAGINLQGGSLYGNGTITANVTNRAVINPGNPAYSEGLITINGNYTQTSAGTLHVDIKGSKIPGTDYDRINVNGTANLGGTLSISIALGFNPTGPNSFTVATFTTHTGQFAKLQPPLATVFGIQYGLTAAVLFFVHWGVDSAGKNKTTGQVVSQITLPFYSSVQQDLGTPDFWGRYIGDQNTSFVSTTKSPCTLYTPTPGKPPPYDWKDIASSEVNVAKQLHLPILPVYFNYPVTSAAVQGYTCGQNYATAAIEFAQHWVGPAIPKGTVIFVDIEGSDLDGNPIATDPDFIKGWYDTFNTTFPYKSPYDSNMYTYESGYYKAGYYADTASTASGNFNQAYCTALSSRLGMQTRSFIWANRPGLSWTTKAKEPTYAPVQPSCASQTFAWQYNAGTPPPTVDVDTDEALSGLPLWRP